MQHNSHFTRFFSFAPASLVTQSVLTYKYFSYLEINGDSSVAQCYQVGLYQADFFGINFFICNFRTFIFLKSEIAKLSNFLFRFIISCFLFFYKKWVELEKTYRKKNWLGLTWLDKIRFYFCKSHRKSRQLSRNLDWFI